MKEELVKNTLIVGMGRIFAQFSSLLLIPVYTMFINPQQYGVGDLVITYATLILPFITLALEQGSFRLLVDARKNELQKTHIISFLFKVVSVMATIGICLAVGLGYFYNQPIIGFFAIYTASSIAVNVCLWLARGLGDNARYSKGSILVGVTSLVLSLITIIGFRMGLVGMLGSLVLANIVGAIYYIYSLKLFKYINLQKRNKKIEKELLNYSLPLIPNGISWWLINAADRTIITIFLGVGASGIFAVAGKFPAILVSLFSIFWVSWHESASLHIKSKGRDKFFSQVANSNILFFGSVGLLILASLSVVFRWVVGDQYSEAYLYVPILMAGSLLHTISTFYGSIYAAKKQTHQILYTTLLAGFVSIIVTIILIQAVGLYAPAIASVVGLLSMTVYRHFDIRKYVKINIDWPKILSFFIISGAAITVYYMNLPLLNILNVIFVGSMAVLLNFKIIKSIKDAIWQKIVR